jgi:predicted unusual protein kinase regulating ubiquinone biosynthesis (AarF/ABC1/UbiB family)
MLMRQRRNIMMRLLAATGVILLGCGSLKTTVAFVSKGSFLGFGKTQTSTFTTHQYAATTTTTTDSSFLPSPDDVQAFMDKLLVNLPQSNNHDNNGALKNLPDTMRNALEQTKMSLLSKSSIPDLSSDIPSLSVPEFKSLFMEPLAELSKQITSYLPNEQLGLLASDAEKAVQVFLTNHPELQPIYDSVQASSILSTTVNANPAIAVLCSAVISYILLSSLLNIQQGPPPSSPYPMASYDATAARQYFDQRPLEVLSRGAQIVTTSLAFGLSILQDKNNNKLEENADMRAEQLTKLLTKLGPSFIKIGQSLSIRTDLLSPAYVRGLQSLQDQVPPFDSKVAFDMMCKEWGVQSVYDVVNDISPEPVASASLGQVYKATLKSTNQPVAIKVQRPNIMNQIALDMHLLREAAPIAKRTFNLNTDTVGTVDAWGKGFVDELDYLQEARNGQSFMESIQTTPLKDVVFAPPVVEDYSSAQVLTTEWVDGERLDKSSNEDVTVLCSIAMNTYLTMMLETGLLHCDPHPGNLLRTRDGRLCILDWGMVTRLDKNLQLTLIEHVAHLTSADYAEIPKDLLLLDFIPKEKADMIEDSGIVEVLADIYGAWTKGGGAAAINVNQVVAQLQDLTATRGNLFQIPPYFAYIAKSFSVLEGIGLTNDPNYSIINECLVRCGSWDVRARVRLFHSKFFSDLVCLFYDCLQPYVSKRLLTDQSERTGGALSTFIFGPEKSNIDTRIVDYDRVEQLVTGFGNYTTSASGALLGREDVTRTQMLEQAADQLLDLIFVEEETPLQSIFLEQLAKIITSTSRSVWAQVLERSGTLPSGRTVLGTLIDPLGFWRTSPLVRMNDLDSKTVETTRKLIALMQQQLQDTNHPIFDLSDLSREELVALSSILVRKVWSKRSGVVATGSRLANQLLKLTADKLERGDRDTIRLPEFSRQTQQPQIESSISEETVVSQGPVSDRLHKAKQRLFDLEHDGDESDITPERPLEPIAVETD